MFKKITRSILQTFISYKKLELVYLSHKNDYQQSHVNIGQLQADFNRTKSVKALCEVEFRVFSQFGDDGIIQYLISKLPIPNKTFIEFGVENYRESNTRFLLTNNYWSGLIIDGSLENVESIRSEQFYSFFDLQVHCAFIDKSNINTLIQESCFDPNVGILSIDVDGNDYWIWEEITSIQPVIVIVEYNALFGCDQALTIPYKDDFVRSSKNIGGLSYFGTSLKALCRLGEKKGYSFIGTNSAGNNSYFIRNDFMQFLSLPNLTCENGYNFSSFSEFWDSNNNAIRGLDKINVLNGCEIYDIDTNQTIKFPATAIGEKLIKENKINLTRNKNSI